MFPPLTFPVAEIAPTEVILPVLVLIVTLLVAENHGAKITLPVLPFVHYLIE